MLFRLFVVGSMALGSGVGWIMASGSSVMLGFYKDQFVDTYERAGLDMSECKNSRRSLLNPGGGMPNCLKAPMTDLMRRMDEGPSASDASFDMPAEEPSLD